MKKSDKIFICIVFTLVVVGLSLVTVGACCGGLTMAKTFITENRIPGISFAVNKVQTSDNNISTAAKDSTTSASADAQDLVISGNMGDVTIEAGNCDEICVDKCTAQCQTVDNRVIITANDTDDMKIIVPKNKSLNEVSISLAAADIEIDGLNCNSLKLSCASGDVDIDTLSVSGTAEVSMDAGDMDISDAVMEAADITMGMGDFEFEGKVDGNLDLSCSMGNAKLTFKDSKDNHNVTATSVLGNVCIDSKRESGINNSISTSSDSDSCYNIVCDCGNVDISFTK